MATNDERLDELENRMSSIETKVAVAEAVKNERLSSWSDARLILLAAVSLVSLGIQCISAIKAVHP